MEWSVQSAVVVSHMKRPCSARADCVALTHLLVESHQGQSPFELYSILFSFPCLQSLPLVLSSRLKSISEQPFDRHHRISQLGYQ